MRTRTPFATLVSASVLALALVAAPAVVTLDGPSANTALARGAGGGAGGAGAGAGAGGGFGGSGAAASGMSGPLTGAQQSGNPTAEAATNPETRGVEKAYEVVRTTPAVEQDSHAEESLWNVILKLFGSEE